MKTGIMPSFLMTFDIRNGTREALLHLETFKVTCLHVTRPCGKADVPPCILTCPEIHEEHGVFMPARASVCSWMNSMMAHDTYMDIGIES